MYETGVVAALLVWLYRCAHLLVLINSTLERNLNRVGQRLSWASSRPIDMTESEARRGPLSTTLRYTLVVLGMLPFVLLSWADVLWTLGHMAYRYTKDVGAPTAVRELRWKLRNREMTFDEILSELAKAGEIPEQMREDFKRDHIASMTLRGLTSLVPK